MAKSTAKKARSDKKPRWNKGVWSWILFDSAAQPFHTLLVTFIFAPYFANFVAPNSVTGQSQWGYATAAAGFMIAVFAPILGSIADAAGSRKPWMALFSIMLIAGTSVIWWAEPGADISIIILVLSGFAIAFVGIELGLVFINSMMADMVPHNQIGRLSGTSWGLGYLAGLVTLIFILLFMVTNDQGKTLIGFDPAFGLSAQAKEGERTSGPLSALWYLVFIIPFFLFTPDTKRKMPYRQAISQGLTSLWQTLKTLPDQKSLFAFLASSMFYRDALNGLYIFGGIYAGGVLGWSITQIGIFGILANLTGVIGGILGGRFDDRFGAKRVVSVSIWILLLACLLVISTDRDSVASSIHSHFSLSLVIRPSPSLS